MAVSLRGEEYGTIPFLDVSRETFDTLRAYATLLVKWNRSINLIGPSTVKQVWDRHVVDSAQLYTMAGTRKQINWLDIGSGGGLPGIVIAILGQGDGRLKSIRLVEKDGRKCAFLRTAKRELDLNINIIEKRLEDVRSEPVDVISARAFSSLENILRLSSRFAKPDTIFLLPKGQTHKAELTAASESWKIHADLLESKTDSSARIIRLKGIPVAHES